MPRARLLIIVEYQADFLSRMLARTRHEQVFFRRGTSSSRLAFIFYHLSVDTNASSNHALRLLFATANGFRGQKPKWGNDSFLVLRNGKLISYVGHNRVIDHILGIQGIRSHPLKDQ